MPELPEVEVVRRGLARWVAGGPVSRVEVRGPRALRRHEAGEAGFVSRLTGATLGTAQRRGKFLWLQVESTEEALVAHLGMSGQLVLPEAGAPAEPHLRVRIEFADGRRPLRFVDQRTFGWMAVEPLVAGTGGRVVPRSVAAIAPDPFESCFDLSAATEALRRGSRPIKGVLLDQAVVSGVGNIYADEALWSQRMHWATEARSLTSAQAEGLVGAAKDVMGRALAVGGTSFDDLYVDVNGRSGYFARALEAYGRSGEPCSRCGTAIVRERFANRSSYVCPLCQGVEGRGPKARAT